MDEDEYFKILFLFLFAICPYQKRTCILKRKLIELIDTKFSKHVSSKNIYILILCCQWWITINLYWNLWANWSHAKSSCTNLPISELKDLVPEKKWGDQTQFSSKKDSRKEQCIWHCLLYLILYQLMDCVIE